MKPTQKKKAADKEIEAKENAKITKSGRKVKDGRK